MTRKRLRILLLVVVLGIGIWGWRAGWFSAWLGGDPATSTIYGNVEVREVPLAFRVGGRIADILVDEGDVVAPGQLLARLDNTPLDDALAAANADIAVANADLSLLEGGSRPQEIAQARAALAAAEAGSVNARKDYDRVRQLAEQGFVSAARVDAALAARDSADAAIAEARARLDLLTAGTRREAIAQGAASRAAALARRRSAATALTDGALVAPAAGVIQTRVQEPGAIVAPGQSLLVLAMTQPVRVRAYVPQPMLSRIKPGQQVTVISDGGAQLVGRIGHIAPSAEFTPRTVETPDQRTDLVYRIRITVADPDGTLRQGQPVTVSLDSPAR